MLAFSNDYYGLIFRATQSVELFCAYGECPEHGSPGAFLFKNSKSTDRHRRDNWTVLLFGISWKNVFTIG